MSSLAMTSSAMTRLAGIGTLAGLLVLGGPARAAEACDALAARVIRATGASLAGRAGPGAVFRAADAERMSLDCRAPRRMVFGSLAREPDRTFFTLIGQAAQALTGARADAVAVLALDLHQDSLLADAPRRGTAGRAALRCETGPRNDSLAGNLTVCVLEHRPERLMRMPKPNDPPVLRRRAGLFARGAAG